MPRIRTIKPEFPQSESMGRVSRDARLLFVQLWTLCDDAGRTRASSRMLASLLYPYDDDAPSLIEGWLGELEREGCVRIYQADGNTYLECANWLKHQKIDKPSKSKIPSFDEGSLIVAKPREPSSGDQGPRTKDQGPGSGSEDRDHGPATPPAADATGARGADLLGDSAPPAKPEAKAAIDQQAVDAWNALAEKHDLPKVQRLTDTRRRALRARLSECGGLDGWTTALAKVAASSFLLGKTSRRGWRADFDFMLQQSSFTKVMEGAYDRNRAGGGEQAVDPRDAGLALALGRR